MIGAMSDARKRSGWLFALGLGASISRHVNAGNDVHLQIVASSADGRHLAVVVNGGTSWVCGLTHDTPNLPLMPTALSVTAQCGGTGPLLPFRQWTWDRETSAVRSLLPLAPVDATKTPPARLALDRDTHVMSLEVLHQANWYPVLVDEASTVDESTPEVRYGSPGLTTPGQFSKVEGFVRVGDNVVVTYSTTDAYGLMVVDRAVALAESEVVNVASRFANARQKAHERTQALGAQYTTNGGLAPLRGVSARSRERKFVSAARDALKLWEQARVFGALDAADVAEALWLLSWLPAATRRQEAMRLYLDLRERDQPSADAILVQLTTDPHTLPLATHLQSRFDPLRGLPPVNGCSFQPVSSAALEHLSNDDLLWLHRAQWAAQGGYRFSDPKVQAYFNGFTWYAPLPETLWRKRVKQLREAPDAPLLKRQGTSVPADACKENLEVILGVERAHGALPPEL